MRRDTQALAAPLTTLSEQGPPQVSIRGVLGFAFGFAARNAREIALRTLAPALVGWIALYVSLVLYLDELQLYLAAPSERVASLALGAVSAGLFVTLLMHSVIAASVVSLALRVQEGGFKYFLLTRKVRRLYAANLRFVLICTVFGAAVQFAYVLATRLSLSAWVHSAAIVILSIGLAFLFVRMGLLTAPVAIAEMKGPILRRAWQLSAGHSWRLTVVVLLLVLPTFAIELAGEILLRSSGTLPAIEIQTPFARALALFQTILPYVLGAVGVAYIAGVVLFSAAGAFVYRVRASREADLDAAQTDGN